MAFSNLTNNQFNVMPVFTSSTAPQAVQHSVQSTTQFSSARSIPSIQQGSEHTSPGSHLIGNRYRICTQQNGSYTLQNRSKESPVLAVLPAIDEFTGDKLTCKVCFLFIFELLLFTPLNTGLIHIDRC